MLDIVAKGFANAKAKLLGRTRLSEANIDEAVREIRVSLLEADVELGVVRTFLDRIKARALGEVVDLEVKQGGKKVASTPGEHFILICHHELEKLLGPVEEAPIVFSSPYTIVMHPLPRVDEIGARATFFLLGMTVANYPELGREIVDRGHEPASHGFAHIRVHEQTRDAFRSDVERSQSQQ